MLVELLALVGIYAIFVWSCATWLPSLAGLLWGSLRDCFCKRKSLAERYGKWAVITGATDGIGKSYAINLAQKGMNVVLISRSEDKLRKVSREIQVAYGVQVRYIVADFSFGSSVYAHIRKELEGVDIGILVNNVGIAMENLDCFEKYSDQDYLRMVNVNILPIMLMTHMVLPWMKQRCRGLLIYISSTAAYWSPPYLAMYSATKCFGHSLSLAVQRELRGTGVELQLMAPSYVKTNMTDQWDVSRYGGWLIPDAKCFGQWATWMIGKSNHSCGHWYHSVLLFLQRSIPLWINMRIVEYIFKHIISRQPKPSSETKRS